MPHFSSIITRIHCLITAATTYLFPLVMKRIQSQSALFTGLLQNFRCSICVNALQESVRRAIIQKPKKLAPVA